METYICAHTQIFIYDQEMELRELLDVWVADIIEVKDGPMSSLMTTWSRRIVELIGNINKKSEESINCIMENTWGDDP